MESLRRNGELPYKPGDEIPIEIGDLIFPFADPACHYDRNSVSTTAETRLRLNLNLGGNEIRSLRILCEITTAEGNGIEIIPFHREAGYIITGDDFDLEKRRKKLLESIRNYDGFGINDDFPLGLRIIANGSALIEDGLGIFAGFNQRHERRIIFNPDVARLLKAIRCHARLDGMEFESKLFPALPTEVQLTIDKDDYDEYCGDFYPLDTGPLAGEMEGSTCSLEDDGSDLEIGVGHELFFADDEKEIRRIGIGFTTVS